ncbi:MAG: hypothetical protein AAFR54_05410, partial [Planctomycetota bacterium]
GLRRARPGTRRSRGPNLADRTVRTLFQHPGLAWPDGFSVGADGWIYVTVNALHESPALGGGPDTDGAAFRILRFQPLAEAFPGR